MKRPTRHLIGLTTALLAAGCAGDPTPRLGVVRANNDHFEARFDAAYFRITEGGQTDVVLISGDRGMGVAGETLASEQALAVTQVLHFRVLWRARSAATSDSPYASNAAIEWSVFGASGDVLRYQGSASVTSRGAGAEMTFSVYNASVVKAALLGAMTDPIGTAHIEGTFTAARDDALVESYLARLGDARQHETASLLTH